MTLRYPTIFAVTICLVVFLTTPPLLGQSSESPEGVDKPAEVAFHNIQVFKGLPQSQLLPLMQFMRASLGVRCDHCHIAENGMYARDDKPAKATARRMIRMADEINRAQFGGQPVITCNTCHRGGTSPVAVPTVTQAAFENTLRADAEPGPQLPFVETILERYDVAMGGREAMAKVTSRVIHAEACRPRLVDPQQVAIPLEIYQKQGRLLFVTQSGEHVTRTGFDGSVTWLTVDGKPAAVPRSLEARMRSLTTTFVLGDIRDLYRGLKTTGEESLDGRKCYVLEGTDRYNRRNSLYFDAVTGYLVRRIAYTRTRLGDDPEQVDFSDFWDAVGVKLPRRVAISTLDNNHLNLVMLVSRVENNASIDNAVFVPPTRQ